MFSVLFLVCFFSICLKKNSRPKFIVGHPNNLIYYILINSIFKLQHIRNYQIKFFFFRPLKDQKSVDLRVSWGSVGCFLYSLSSVLKLSKKICKSKKRAYFDNIHAFPYIQREFSKTRFHAVCYIGTMLRLVQIETCFLGIVHCNSDADDL